MAENLGVPEVQLGLVKVAPADPGPAETEGQPAVAGDQLVDSALNVLSERMQAKSPLLHAS
jgi:hypothetical protein